MKAGKLAVSFFSKQEFLLIESFVFNLANMELCQNLCQIEDIVSKNYFHGTLVVPHALASPLTDKDITFLQENNRDFNKLKDMVRIYDASYTAGLRIESDSFDGFGLVNQTGSTIKIGIIEHTVGML